MKALILDTSAFIQGFSSSNQETKLYTTPLVLNEIKDDIAIYRISNWTETGKLIIMMPEGSSLEQTISSAQRMGESHALSDTDISVLALAHQISQKYEDATLVSDDYSVQNLADEIGLNYTGLGTRGIKRRFKWIYYCPGCRKEFDKPQSEHICPICGTELKRKPVKKSRRRGVE